MGPPIPERIVKWAEKQKVFFVATAPLSANGHVNVSPKTAAEFRFLDDQTVCYLDNPGSGGETAAHIIQNKRCTFMFVALAGAPKIVRFYGKGRIFPKNEFFTKEGNLVSHGEAKKLRELYCLNDRDDSRWHMLRSIIILDVERVADSCGYSIPKYEYVKDRSTLQESIDKYVEKENGMEPYMYKKNSFSIDGLKGIAQIINGSTPTRRIPEQGYYFAEYDSQPGKGSLSAYIRQLFVHLQMMYAAGLNGRNRDVAFFLAGALFIGAYARLRSKFNNNRS